MESNSKNNKEDIDRDFYSHDSLEQQRNELFHSPLQDALERINYGMDLDESRVDEEKNVLDEENEEDWDRDETFMERLISLKEMVPENTRNKMSLYMNCIYNTLFKSVKFAGRWTWITTTSLLLVGLPLILETEKEQVLFDFETSQFQQQTAQQMLQGVKQ
jgi:import receptor subunit TOM22